jgi:hypothetical protein
MLKFELLRDTGVLVVEPRGALTAEDWRSQGVSSRPVRRIGAQQRHDLLTSDDALTRRDQMQGREMP